MLSSTPCGFLPGNISPWLTYTDPSSLFSSNDSTPWFHTTIGHSLIMTSCFNIYAFIHDVLSVHNVLSLLTDWHTVIYSSRLSPKLPTPWSLPSAILLLLWTLQVPEHPSHMTVITLNCLCFILNIWEYLIIAMRRHRTFVAAGSPANQNSVSQVWDIALGGGTKPAPGFIVSCAIPCVGKAHLS